jgi:cell division protein FtsL
VKRPASWAVAVVLAVVTLVALAHVWVHLQVIAVGYDISRETRRRQELAEQQQRLKLELRTRMDLGAVERAARERLGMVPPRPDAIRRIGAPALAQREGAR